MSETKYHFRREGNHFKLSSSQNRSEQAERPTPVQPIAPKRVKRSIWSRIGSFFGILFSGIVMIFGFLIATPFFLLSVLLNWIKLSIGLSIFWVIAFFAYQVFILDAETAGNPFDSVWTVLALLILALIGAIMSSLAE